jgi:hypothetical protein
MSKPFCFGMVALPLMILGSFPDMLRAQAAPAQEPAQPPPTQQPAEAPPEATAPSKPTVIPSTPPPKDPFVLEDGGLYIEPLYWLNTGQPRLRSGHAAAGPGDFQYGGNAKAGIGLEIGAPAGRSNTLRITYFRLQGNSSQTLTKDTTIFSQGYTTGDFINADSKLQLVKVSWDYLSYSWRKPSATLHLKTLYEIQYVSTKINTAAPFKAITTDASGNTNTNVATGSKSVVLPTFGMALGSQLGKYFRWDMRGSGFGIPKRGVIGDAEGSIGLRLGKVELVVGERFLYFKTSTRKDLYVTDTLQGVFAGLRFAWRGSK